MKRLLVVALLATICIGAMTGCGAFIAMGGGGALYQDTKMPMNQVSYWGPSTSSAAKKGEEKRTEPIVPTYSDIRQRSAAFVFYVWLWFSIAVLIYFLRQWIKEADRVYKAKYYEPEESPRKGNPMAPALGE
jgi:hypothetical protein